MERQGNLSINSDNIFPIIKKWLYSDQDIFIRELISNGCDAITKLKKLAVMGDYEEVEGEEYKIEVYASAKDKTLTFVDNGLGMTEEEVDKYINQIAFSGATDFINKYKDKAGDEQIIGHFGLGFYSAFMVADKVTIETCSYKEGAKPVYWECDGGTNYTMSESDDDIRGTAITLYLNEDCLEYANEYRVKEVIQKYCAFMPYNIYFINEDKEEEEAAKKEAEKKEKDKVIEVDTTQEDELVGDAPKKDEAEEVKAQVAANAARLAELEAQETELEAKVLKIMMTIPNIIDPSVPIGKDDSENVEIEKFGEPVVPDYEIPYHTDIMEKFNGIDLEAAGKVAGNGFYYLMGDIARLHSAVISYARDFMIDRGFTYCIPPFMIRSNVVTGVMSFAEMDAMMYKIEGEDLYLIGTSEHSMIGKFIDTITPESELPKTLTSYSPCFRKEKGAHGIEERGVYRIHQFEKQEMIVVCKPEESKMWFDKLWQNTVDLFRSLDIPVRTLECCSGDLADLKVKSIDVEAWSPRQKKYFEVGSCSNLGDAQARRLKIRVQDENKKKYFAHTLNNTVVAPPRMLIAFLENNLNEDGTVSIPEALRPYMGGTEKLVPKK